MKNNFQQLMEIEEEQVQLPSGMRRQLGERLKVLQALGTLFDVYVHQAFRGGLELSNVLSSTAAEVVNSLEDHLSAEAAKDRHIYALEVGPAENIDTTELEQALQSYLYLRQKVALLATAGGLRVELPRDKAKALFYAIKTGQFRKLGLQEVRVIAEFRQEERPAGDSAVLDRLRATVSRLLGEGKPDGAFQALAASLHRQSRFYRQLESWSQQAQAKGDMSSLLLPILDELQPSDLK